MKPQLGEQKFGRFNLHEVARAFPPTAETLLLDTYLTDEPSASSQPRVPRISRDAAALPRKSDEHLFVLSGRGTFWMERPDNGGEFQPGHLLVFKRRTIHALPNIIEPPVVFLAIDTPRRDPHRHHLRQSGGRHAGELHPRP
jgi:mannose-6-phosphate isomerase-like protein (cupin superfamily)